MSALRLTDFRSASERAESNAPALAESSLAQAQACERLECRLGTALEMTERVAPRPDEPAGGHWRAHEPDRVATVRLQQSKEPPKDDRRASDHGTSALLGEGLELPSSGSL